MSIAVTVMGMYTPSNDPENDPVAFNVVPFHVKFGTPPNAPALLYCICVVDPPGEPPPPPLPVLTVIGNVVPLPLVNVIVFNDTDAVTMAFGVNEAVEANEALVAVIAFDIDPLKYEALNA